jgi:glycosyltransferase involved in cell wall biosynthesis
MKTPPQLSVIIPTYNRAVLLRRAIESVLHQTFMDYEIIVIDDGSTDRTEDLIAQVLAESPTQDERIRYFFQRNQGKSIVLNYGLSEARGEWIAFLDSDDLWLPNKIEEQFHALQQFAPQSGASFTDARYINNSSNRLTAFECGRKKFPDRIGLIPNSACFGATPYGVYMQSILVHSRVMAKVGEFDPTLWTGQDVDFVFRLGLQTTLCYVNSALVLIDRTPDRSEALTKMRIRRDYEVLQLRQQMFKKWLELGEGRGADVRRAIRSHLRGVHSESANWLLKKKRYREARRAIREAARVELTPGIAAKWCLATVIPGLARAIVIRRSNPRYGGKR